MRTARVLFPALRWDPDRGFEGYREVIETALELGVGGFILFGGEAPAVRELVTELKERSPEPLLIGADLERGAGQQFEGATPLPPVAALGAVDDLNVTRRAGALTAREARALGVNWVYAPVADLDLEPDNPIIGTRAFGRDAVRVARHVVAWIEGCRAGGALACVKHFPGHGRTVRDSHLELPHVDAGPTVLEADDLVPFRAALDAGVGSVMTAHVAYPALDASAAPATLSRPIITGLLRETLGYDGLVVTDALIMEGVLEGRGGEEEAAVAALAAGCDALLYPGDLRGVAAAVERAVGDGLGAERVDEAIRRVDDAARSLAAPVDGDWGVAPDRAWALSVAMQAIQPVRGRAVLPSGPVDVLTVDDDVGGPYSPPARDTFPATLRRAGVDAREVEELDGKRGAVIAVYADIRAWKGRPGISAQARGAVARALEARPDAVTVLFGHPRLASGVPDGAVVAAWGGEQLMQKAAAHWLAAGEGRRASA